MAVEAFLSFMINKNGKRVEKKYRLVDFKLVLDRSYDKYQPDSSMLMKYFEVTVTPDHQDKFFQKWYADKSALNLYLKAPLTGGDNYQESFLEGAVCYSLSESFDLVSPASKNRTRPLKLRILAQNFEVEWKKSFKTKAKKDKNEYTDDEQTRIKQFMKQAPANLTEAEKERYAKNEIYLEKLFQLKKGDGMTIEEADIQKTNPNRQDKWIRNDGTQTPKQEFEYEVFVKDEGFEENNDNSHFETFQYTPYSIRNPNYKEEYTINCATCATAYPLRRRGFDIYAKGNCKENVENAWLALNKNWAQVWSNADGSKAQPIWLRDWMRKHKLNEMKPFYYKQFIEQYTQEEGIYILSIAWPDATIKGENSSGHNTILERWRDEKDGKLKLSHIEPQHFDPKKGSKRKMENLYVRLTPWPADNDGILRVDDKLFDAEENNNWGKLFMYNRY